MYLVIVGVCLAIVGGVLVLEALTKKRNAQMPENEDNIEDW